MEHLVNDLLDLLVEIQQIPAPTFAEMQRAQFVQARFLAEGLQDVSLDGHGNVFGRLPGTQGGANLGAESLVVSAHLDTVFPAGTDLTCQRTADRIAGPGIGDNSLGVAGLFGLLWALRQHPPLAGDLWLAANVGEEGLGDLCGMKAVVDRFGSAPLGYLVLEGMALGAVYHRALGVQRYQITCRCQGGHSWSDYGRPSAVHELARLVTFLERIPRPGAPRHTLNVGVFHGGTTINTIAAEASLELDLRSEDARVLADMAAQVEQLVRTNSRKGEHAVQFSMELIGSRPAGELPAGHPWLDLAAQALHQHDLEPNFTIGSTDANIPLSRGLTAMVVGLTRGGGAHTVHEYIETGPLGQGLSQLVTLVRSILA